MHSVWKHHKLAWDVHGPGQEDPAADEPSLEHMKKHQ